MWLDNDVGLAMIACSNAELHLAAALGEQVKADTFFESLRGLCAQCSELEVNAVINKMRKQFLATPEQVLRHVSDRGAQAEKKKPNGRGSNGREGDSMHSWNISMVA